jgi:agmatine/peptidylarginine deiminase
MARAATLRLPGEFEHQHALLLGCRELSDEVPYLFAEVVGNVNRSINVVVMVNDPREETAVRQKLEDWQVYDAKVQYVVASHDTMWVRDYGPLVVVDESGRVNLVDSNYNADDRPADEDVPQAVARSWRRPVVRSQLVLEGGNLLSNGRGLLIATEALLTENVAKGWTEDGLRTRLTEVYGCRQLVLLEELIGEPNRHVDMFATFVSSGTVVVGRYDPATDPDNAAVLDRNAFRLSQVMTQDSPLQVVRIPMPPSDGDVWPTYTNVIYANGVLLVPVYPGLDPDGRDEAIDTFARLLPGWRVVPVDASELLDMYGGLHCLSMNLGPIGRLPVAEPPQVVEPPIRIPSDPWPADTFSLRRFDPAAESSRRVASHTMH